MTKQTRQWARPVLLAACIALSVAPRATAETRSTEAAVASSGTPFAADRKLSSFDEFDMSVPLQPRELELISLEYQGQRLELELRAHSILAPDTLVLVETESGMEPYPHPATTTYRGQVTGVPGSRVAVSLFNGQMQGLIRFPWDQELWIQPGTRSHVGRGSRRHVLYAKTQVLPEEGSCGVDTPGVPIPPVDLDDDSRNTYSGATNTCYAISELMVDTDYEYFQAIGSSTAATLADIVGLINTVEMIFREDAQIVYHKTAIVIRSDPNDPYSSSD